VPDPHQHLSRQHLGQATPQKVCARARDHHVQERSDVGAVNQRNDVTVRGRSSQLKDKLWVDLATLLIARGEVELRTCDPRFDLHHELGLAYNAIGEYQRAFEHLQAEVG